jgi:ketosteroid isomerase-like protein
MRFSGGFTMQRVRSFSMMFAAAFAAFFFAACGQPAAPPDNRAADAAAVRKADADWSAAAQAHNADSWVAFYADDAVVLPPNSPTLTNRDAIHGAITEMLALPGLSVSWRTTKAEAARSGDLAYTYGTYELASNDAKGRPTTDHGKYSEVWKKQADGSWKCIVDMWSSDMAVAPAPAPKTKHHAAKRSRRRHHAS